MELICQDCRSRVVQQEEKALSREVQVVWATVTDGEWVCPATKNEHRPGDIWPWVTEQGRSGRMEPNYGLILEAAQAAVQTAHGDSNDDEINTLREALELALDGLCLKMPDSYEVDDD